MSNIIGSHSGEEGRDDAEMLVSESEILRGNENGVVKLADRLAERGEKRNDFSDRLRDLRDKMIRTKVRQDIIEERESSPDTGDSSGESDNIFHLIRQRCLQRKELAQAEMMLLDTSRTKEEKVKELQKQLDQARVDLKAYKQRGGDERSLKRPGKADETSCDATSKPFVPTRDQRIDILELKLAERDRRLQRMSDDLAEANRRTTELEVRLEVHDFKFISYQKYRKELDKQALRQIHKDTLCESSSYESESSSQKYTAKLISDLENIENMYISAKQKIAQLEQERSEYLARIQTLESAAASAPNQHEKRMGLKIEDNCPDDENEKRKAGLPLSNYVMTRMQLLETENISYNQLMSNLKEKLETTTDKMNKVVEKYERDTCLLNRKNDSLEEKITALQIEIKAISGDMDATEKSKQYHILETNLDDYIAEISRLEERLRTKERIIARLRSKSVEKRLANVLSEDEANNLANQRVITAV